jgi:hypothetical protein
MEDLEKSFLESIRPLIVEEVRKQVSELAPVSDGNDENPYVDSKWLCDTAHICNATRINLAKRGIIRPYHLGSRVLYKRGEVMDAIESGKLSRYSHK